MTWNASTQQLTINGQGFGSLPPSTAPAPGQGIDQANLMVTDLKTQTNYGWSFGTVNTDWYGIIPVHWSNDQIVACLGGPLPQAGDRIQVSWWRPIGYLDTEIQQINANWSESPSSSAPVPISKPAATLSSESYVPSTRTLIITGNSLGTEPNVVPPAGEGWINWS